MLLLLLWFLIRLPSVQNFAKNKILHTLSEKYNADWEIDDIKIKFIDSAEAKGILFKDQQGDTLFSADKLHIDIGLFSLFSKEIFIDDITTDNAYVHIYEMTNGEYNFDFLIPPTDSTDTSTDGSPWSFGIGSTNLRNTVLDYSNSDLRLLVSQKAMAIDFNELDISNQKIDIDEISSENTIIKVTTSEPSEESSVFVLPNIDWDISIEETSLLNHNIFVDQANPIKALVSELEIDDFNYKDGIINANVEQISGSYNDQINLTNTEGVIQIEGSNVDLNKVKIKTDKDFINIENAKANLSNNNITSSDLDILVSYKTINIFSEYIPDNIQILKNQSIQLKASQLNYSPKEINTKNLILKYGNAINLAGSIDIKAKNNQFNNPSSINVNLKKLTTDIKELDYVLKDFTIPDSLSNFKTITASGKANGNLQELKINDLAISVDDILNLRATGIINDITDQDKLSYDLDFTNLDADITKLPIPPNESIAIDSLGTINYTGKISGNLKDIKLDGNLQSDLGDLKANIQIGIAEGIDKLSYDGVLSLKAFDIGTLLKNDDLGKITFQTELKGQGLQITGNNSKLKGSITDFDYKGYTYQLIDINAIITDGMINGQIDIDDPNVKLHYDGLISIEEGNTTFDFVAEIDTLNLYPLYLYKDSISLSAMIESKFSVPLNENQEQIVNVSQLILSNPDDYYKEDSISLIAQKIADSTFVSAKAKAFDLQMDGRYKIKSLPSSINQFVNQYFNMDTLTEIVDERSESFHLYGHVYSIKPIDIILREELVQSKDIAIDMMVDFFDSKISGGLSVDSIFYDDIFSKKVDINLNSNKDDFSVNIDAYENEFKSVVINKVSLNNTFKDDKLFSTLTAIDENDIPKIKFGTEIYRQDSSMFITLQDSVILNNKDWTINSDNPIEIVSGEVTFYNLILTDGIETLKVNSTDNGEKELDIDFDNFNVSQCVYLMTDQESDLTGSINGNVKVKNIYNDDVYYIVNLDVNDMTYDSTNVGVLKIHASAEPNSSLINTEISLEGVSNHVAGGGTYDIKSSALDFSLNVDAFELMLLDPFLAEIISDSEGLIRGNATLKGTPSKPEVNAEIELQKVNTTIVANNTRYRIDEHTIYIDNESIDVGILDIYDQDENIATFTGNIYHDLLSDFKVDLVIETTKFTFLNTSSKENPVFYGTVVVDAVGTIIGPPDLLNVDITATSLKGTDITISPFSAETYLEEEYITYGTPEEFKDLTNEYLLKLAQVYPFDVNLLLDVDDQSKLTFVVDPISGDKISGCGNGNLRIKLNPDGEQEFFGTYTVDEGSYTFTYGDFFAKDFKINPGGTVKFNGNPLNATLEIDAIYNVYTTTFELIRNEVFLDEDDIDASKLRTNVEVYLTLIGRLEEPEIKLDIKIPDLQSSTLINPIDNKLNEIRNNTNELNNQVFGLILFDNFIVSNNATSGFNNFGSNLALSSISNLISNQLNNFAQNVIKGVNVNINVNSYDDSFINDSQGGNVTEVGLNVSKQLFNDRLSISATGNVDIQGNDEAGSFTSFIGNFVLEYKLTEDGRYRLRVFSKNDFDRIVNSNSEKTGVSIFFKKSFDSKINK
ncbi:translocation/assembly module TamB domain-containing protein [Saprospiraceae bacterium]|nr:translocation/assembly module TamB domain-containing protein [Saprospiraceae bacterium]